MADEIQRIHQILSKEITLNIDLWEYLSIAIKRPLKAVIPNTQIGITISIIKELFNTLDVDAEVVSDSKIPYLITENENIGRVPIYRYGVYYIMELVSVVPLYIWGDYKDEERTILDISAAPGGKTFLLSNIFKKGVIIANEPNRIRLRRLQNNMQKYLLPNIILTQYRGEKFPVNFQYDMVLFDAPCSSLNLIYKRRREVLSNIKRTGEYGKLQKKIIRNIYNLLAEGGELLYITCTLSKAECEDVVKHAIELGFKVVDTKWKLPFKTVQPRDDEYPEISKTHYIIPSLNLDRFGGNIGTSYVALLRR